jgi:hypothetical protein
VRLMLQRLRHNYRLTAAASIRDQCTCQTREEAERSTRRSDVHHAATMLPWLPDW